MIQIKPPLRATESQKRKFSLFLAGSIESGTAEDWQTKVAKALEGFDIVIYNPRRDAWDASWEQSIDNPKFAEQVNWELDHIERCDLVGMYFDPGTKSPISLLELGLIAKSDQLRQTREALVCAPKGFWRKGNVDIVCKRYGVDQVSNLDEFIDQIKRRIVAYQSAII